MIVTSSGANLRTAAPLRARWVAALRCWLALAIGLTLGAALPAAGVEPAPKPRRIVLITLDTVRGDAFDPVAEGSAPLLERTRAWAEKGRVFQRYYSATSSTQPSHATLFTGLHPWQHGVSRNGIALEADRETLAENLQQAGYRTGAVVSSFPVHSRFGFEQGFDTYREEFTEGSAKRWSGVRNRQVTFSSRADHVLAEALEMLDQVQGPRQFFWFHFFDAHDPYGDEAEEGEKPTQILEQIHGEGGDADAMLAKARAGYAKDIGYLDRHIDRLFQRLMADAEQIETHIVVVSDHGESFGENGGSLGHGKRLTPEQIVVPFFVLSPRVAQGVDATPVGTVDIGATILDLAGVEGSLGSSRSLLAPSPEAPVVGMRRTFKEPFEDRRTDGTVHVADGYLFYSVRGDQVLYGNRQRVAKDDMLEAPVEGELAESLKILFGAFEAELGGEPARDSEDPEVIERLRALGYVQ